MRRNSFFFLTLVALSITYSFHFQAQAAPAGPLIKHLSSLLKWTRSYSSSKAPQTDGNVVQFENGYLVETVVEGNDIGVVPYKIGVSEDGELFAVDSINSKVVRVTPPLSQYSRARLIAGSFQGYTGHVDGKPSEARFNHPKGVTMDDQGNVYVADTLNLAIRKISDSGVTTIAGGKSNVAGYTDGPSEDAKFSNDFDVVYVRPTCSLLVIDRGNAALRQIPLGVEDCNYQYSSISPIDVLMVLGAVVIGYATCMLQQGLGPSSPKLPSEHESKGKPSQAKPATWFADPTKEEPGWPSFGQLLIDLSKIGAEALGGLFLYFVPSRLGPKKGLTPLKDSLRMPEDDRPAGPTSVQRHIANPPPVSEARHVHGPNPSEKYSDNTKPAKMKSSSFKDRPSKRHDYAEFYGAGGEAPPAAGRSKSQKERTRHRQREKSGEVGFSSEQKPKPKPVEAKPVDYDNPKFDHYNMRNSRYGPDDSFRF